MNRINGNSLHGSKNHFPGKASRSPNVLYCFLNGLYHLQTGRLLLENGFQTHVKSCHLCDSSRPSPVQLGLQILFYESTFELIQTHVGTVERSSLGKSVRPIALNVKIKALSDERSRYSRMQRSYGPTMSKLIILLTIIYSLVVVASAAPRQYPAAISCNQWVTVYSL